MSYFNAPEGGGTFKVILLNPTPKKTRNGDKDMYEVRMWEGDTEIKTSDKYPLTLSLWGDSQSVCIQAVEPKKGEEFTLDITEKGYYNFTWMSPEGPRKLFYSKDKGVRIGDPAKGSAKKNPAKQEAPSTQRTSSAGEVVMRRYVARIVARATCLHHPMCPAREPEREDETGVVMDMKGLTIEEMKAEASAAVRLMNPPEGILLAIRTVHEWAESCISPQDEQPEPPEHEDFTGDERAMENGEPEDAQSNDDDLPF